MKNIGKIVSILLLVTTSVSSVHAATDTVSCDSSPSFVANSCNQCFVDSDAVAEGEVKGLLTDIWENNSDGAQIVYTQEQDLPQIVSLNGASWSEVKASDGVDFWKFSEDFEALFSEDDGGHILEAGQSVRWLESTLGSGYRLDSSSADVGSPVGLIVYDLGVHNILADGEPAIDIDTHRECVLVNSAAVVTEPVVDTTTGEVVEPTPAQPGTPAPKVLPETGPEHFLLALAALLLTFGFFYFRRKA